MTDTIFFRLLDEVNRPSRLSGAIEKLREDGKTADTYSAEPASFQQVPGSPFAYWVSSGLRSKFTELSPFESKGRTVKQGLSTADDSRFVRAWWEVASARILDSGNGLQDEAKNLQKWCRERTSHGKGWVPFANGGERSPYYADIHLVLKWEQDGQEMKSFERAVVRNPSFYFRPGLTWPLRASRFSPFALPGGCIFSARGYAVLAAVPHLTLVLGLGSSAVFDYLFKVMLGRFGFPEFIVGTLQQLPIPDLSAAQATRLGVLALRCVNLKRSLDGVNEISHAFHLPVLLQTEGVTLEERLARWQDRVLDGERQLARYQREIDDLAFQLYGIEDEDRQAIEEPDVEDGATVTAEDNGATEEDADEVTAVLGSGTLVADLLSYAIGCVFGRWDARIALDPSIAPDLADPFAPLPVCSPGMLVGPDGLPANRNGIASEEWMRARPDAITPPPDGSVENLTIPDSEYPLAVDWDGILVDDPEHEDDILRRVREVLDLLWGERADAIEGEACDLLGLKDLRTFFRNPRQFFEHHIKRYSKSRRKAPIYWLLQSPKRNYGLWLYYHRLDPDILFKALHKYVEPKVRLEESRLDEYEARRRSAGTGGREAKQAEKAVEKQEELLTDLREFRNRLERTAKLHLRPDLNDGVVLNIAPLHELVPWKEAKSKWNELLSGKYEWSSIGKQLREKGMV